MRNTETQAQNCMVMPPQNQPQMKKWISPPNIIDFTSGTPTVSLVNNNITGPYIFYPSHPATETDGTGRFSSNAAFDKFGNLLFYVIDGIILNSLGYMMNERDVSNFYSAQYEYTNVETTIVPRPGHPMQFYVITPIGAEKYDEPHSNLLEWSIVDMNQPTDLEPYMQGMGKVVSDWYDPAQRIDLDGTANNRANKIQTAVSPQRPDGTYLMLIYFDGQIKQVEISSTGLTVVDGWWTPGIQMPQAVINTLSGNHTSELEMIELPSTTPALDPNTTPTVSFPKNRTVLN